MPASLQRHTIISNHLYRGVDACRIGRVPLQTGTPLPEHLERDFTHDLVIKTAGLKICCVSQGREMHFLTPPRLHSFLSEGVLLLNDPAGNPLVRLGWHRKWEMQ